MPNPNNPNDPNKNKDPNQQKRSNPDVERQGDRRMDPKEPQDPIRKTPGQGGSSEKM